MKYFKCFNSPTFHNQTTCAISLISLSKILQQATQLVIVRNSDSRFCVESMKTTKLSVIIVKIARKN